MSSVLPQWLFCLQLHNINLSNNKTLSLPITPRILKTGALPSQPGKADENTMLGAAERKTYESGGYFSALLWDKTKSLNQKE